LAHGGFNVVIGRLLEKALLQERGNVVGGGRNKSAGDEERRENGSKMYFHGVSLAGMEQVVVMVL
jgi:hypothetical protein